MDHSGDRATHWAPTLPRSCRPLPRGRPPAPPARLDWNYEGEESGVAAVYEECGRPCTASIEGIAWDRLARESSVTYPCLTSDDPGQPIVFTGSVPHAHGQATCQLVPASVIPAAEKPSAEFPFG